MSAQLHMRATNLCRSRFWGPVVAACIAGATATLAAAVPAAPAAAAIGTGPTIVLSRSSGAVGDTVNLKGNTGCATSRVTVGFDGPRTTGGYPYVAVHVPVAANGAWSVHAYEIPDFLEGGASFLHAPVVPGAYTFVASSQCGATVWAAFEVTGTFATQPASRFVGMAPTKDGKGYWLAQKNGGVFSYGDAHFYGSLPAGPGGLGITPAAPISGIAATPDGGGYWLVGEDGGVFSFGDAHFYGSLPGEGIHPYGQIVGITPTPDAKGYWLIGADGGVFTFGDAGYYGGAGYDTGDSALVSTSDGGGYFRLWLTGAVYGVGDATDPALQFSPGMALHTSYTHWFSGMAETPDGKGLWRVGTDGGVFTLGDAPYDGSVPGLGITAAAPIVGIAATPDGGGYWLVGADGGVFSFGDAHFYGSAGESGLAW